VFCSCLPQIFIRWLRLTFVASAPSSLKASYWPYMPPGDWAGFLSCLDELSHAYSGIAIELSSAAGNAGLFCLA